MVGNETTSALLSAPSGTLESEEIRYSFIKKHSPPRTGSSLYTENSPSPVTTYTRVLVELIAAMTCPLEGFFKRTQAKSRLLTATIGCCVRKGERGGRGKCEKKATNKVQQVNQEQAVKQEAECLSPWLPHVR